MTADLPVQGSDIRILEEFLKQHPNVKIFSVQWIDLCGWVRSRLVPRASFIELVKANGYLPGSPVDHMLGNSQEIRDEIFAHFTDKGGVVPDLTSLRIANHDSAKLGNTAVVYASANTVAVDGRDILKNVVKKARAEAGLTFLTGFELEFCFLNLDSVEGPMPQEAGMFNAAFTQRSIYWPVLNQIGIALEEAGLNVLQIHKEYGRTQFELSLPPMTPVEAVDAYIFAREVIKDIAYQHKLNATFYPDPLVGEVGLKTGTHIHISATPVSKTSSFEPDQFLAGMLSHLPALFAFGLPKLDSYTRVGEHAMGAGTFVAWGVNNRGMPIRRVTENHWEVRCHDATSNPYLMVAGIIAAGLDAKPLTMKSIDQFIPSEEERKEAGITEKVPANFPEALAALQKDEAWAKSFLTENAFKYYQILRTDDYERESKLGEKERKLKLVGNF